METPLQKFNIWYNEPNGLYLTSEVQDKIESLLIEEKELYNKQQQEISDLHKCLNNINSTMWESFMIKGREFTQQDGIKIMNTLNEWAEKY
jgi:hypothetical protein